MLVERWRDRERREDRRFAQLCCILANCHGGDDGQPFEIPDFMPMTEKDLAKRERAKTAADQRKVAAVFTAMAARGHVVKVTENHGA